MNTNTPTRLKNVKGGQWRIELRDRADHMRLCLAAQSATLDPDRVNDATQYLDEVYSLLDDRQTPSEWWSGSQIELAWTKMRMAEEARLRAENDQNDQNDIVGSGRTSLGKAQGHLAAGDPSLTALTTTLDKIGSQPAAVGHDVALAKRLSIDVALAYFAIRNTEHQAQRQLRNVLRILVAVLALLGTALVVLGIWSDRFPILVALPPGISQGHGITIALALGALGALFSAIPSLATAPANATTYNPRAEQAGLKIAVGAWSGLLGLVAATAGLTTSGATGQSLAGFVIVCMGFGAAQEALTRFADQKAEAANPSTT